MRISITPCEKSPGVACVFKTGEVLLERTEKKITVHSTDETVRLGKQLGVSLNAGDLVALVGELGSGKTWFTKGVALGIGVHPKTVVSSPSFALVHEYRGKCPLYHMDVFRIDSPDDFFLSGLEEYLNFEGVVIMEWADRLAPLLPHNRIWVEFSILDEHSREILFSGSHPRAAEVLVSL
jgi:tRNA threonylcarbamoyladenosine biosynthesis protein TsaE